VSQPIVDLVPLRDPETLAFLWRALEREAEGSVFIGWNWIGTWLRHFARRPWLLQARCGRDVVGLAVLCPRLVLRRGLLPVRRLFLHATGDGRADAITIEYNDLLVHRAGARDIRAAMTAGLLARRRPCFSELVLPGMAAVLPVPAGCPVRLAAVHPSFRVDLTSLDGAYPDTLAPRVRRNLRRTLELYRARGAVELDVARDVETALAWLDALARLHVAKWRARAHPGPFADPAFLAFHRELVARALPAGEAALLRLRVAGEPVAFLYLLHRRGHVFFYAGGFVFEQDNRLRPGLAAHALAIDHLRREGARIYDLGAGDERYKRELAAPGPEIVTAVIARPTPLRRIEHRLRQLRTS